MNFKPTNEQRPWEERAARLAREALAARAAAMEARGSFPHENFEDLRRKGFLRLAVPPWYGGLWVDHVTYASAANLRNANVKGTHYDLDTAWPRWFEPRRNGAVIDLAGYAGRGVDVRGADLAGVILAEATR